MRMIRPESLGNNYIQEIENDLDKNILLLRMKSSSIIVLQLVRKQEFKSTIIESVRCSNAENDTVTSFKWLARMNCYIEGSMRGYLKLRDIEKKGECFLQISSAFSERIQSLYYN